MTLTKAVERVKADLAWHDKHGDMGRCMFANADDIRAILAAAQVDRNPEGEKPQALSAKHESPVVADDAPERLVNRRDNNGLG